MRVIVIGAGRGRRLMPTTADAPKCFAEVSGRRILDWALDAFRRNGVDDIAFVGGYQIGRVRESYPEFTFRHNRDWETNNILASLFHAEDLMDDGFVCCYSDVLFTPRVVDRLLASEAAMSMVVDTAWSARYEHRSEHPADDAEKVTVEGGRVTRVARDIPVAKAHGEYIGVAKFSAAGAARLKAAYHEARRAHEGRAWRGAATFEKAYKILLFQQMIEDGDEMVAVETPGGYIEVDTQQDFEYARRFWVDRHLDR